MQGSFDHPPIVISGSRWRGLLPFLSPLPFIASVAFVLFSPHTPDPSTWDFVWGGLALLAFGGCSLYFGCQLIWPSKVIVGPDGLTSRTAFGSLGLSKNSHYDWSEIAGFELWRHHTFASVGVRLKRNEQGASIANPMLAGGLEISAAKACRLLNEALRRWAPG
ncbi:MAG TPA: hypothetical protein VGO34_00770 [Alphaproteobacteria bacterium]|jgi:hypothetical protein